MLGDPVYMLDISEQFLNLNHLNDTNPLKTTVCPHQIPPVFLNYVCQSRL